MNSTINTFINHRSIRQYKDNPIEAEKLDAIIKAVHHAPTSINGQQVSVIVVTDKEKKSKVAEYAGGQTWIDQAPVFLLFVMDYHRAHLAAKLNGENLVITESIESIMVGSVDVGIALGTAIGAAESLGLGTVPIGGVRKSPEEMIALFELPELVYPVAGLVLGYPEDMSEMKPRIPLSIFKHDNTYNPDQSEALKAYDQQMSDYMVARTGGESNRNWSQGVAGTYKFVYFPKVYPTLKQQGFENAK